MAAMLSVGKAACAAVALAVCAGLAGCNKSDENKNSTEADAGADAGKVTSLDPELAQAMAAASVGGPGARAPQAEGAPPPNGILAPGAADKEAPKGSPPRLALGGEGSDPKMSLSPARPEPGSKLSGTIQVVTQQGQQGGGLPVQFALSLEPQKVKEGEGSAGFVKMVARVTGATIPVTGAGKDLEALIGKLKGARIEYLIAPDGAGSSYKIEAPKTMPADLVSLLESLRDTLAVVTLPVPSKPVGTGAYWMVTSREGVLGLDLVSYRLVKLEAIKDGVATLSVNTKRYATSNQLDMPGLPPDAPRAMSQFDSMSDSRLQYKPGAGFPLGGDVTSALAIGLGDAPGAATPNQPRQQQGLVIQTRAMLSFGAPPPAQ